MKHTIHFDTGEGIRNNLSVLTGVEKSEIDAFIDSMKEWTQTERDHRRVWGSFQKEYGCNPVIKQAVWFHGCRCLPKNDFKQGLLPNHQALDLIWQQLWEITREDLNFSSSQEMKERYESHSDSVSLGGYRDRLLDQRQKGPWGKLVRDEWFLSGTHSNHYHESGPEIVGFILRHFSPDGALEKKYLQKTKGCLVHFRTPCTNPVLLGHGINFLRDIRFCQHSIEYIGYYGLESMEGHSVPYSDTIKVEFL